MEKKYCIPRTADMLHAVLTVAELKGYASEFRTPMAPHLRVGISDDHVTAIPREAMSTFTEISVEDWLFHGTPGWVVDLREFGGLFYYTDGVDLKIKPGGGGYPVLNDISVSEMKIVCVRGYQPPAGVVCEVWDVDTWVQGYLVGKNTDGDWVLQVGGVYQEFDGESEFRGCDPERTKQLQLINELLDDSDDPAASLYEAGVRL